MTLNDKPITHDSGYPSWTWYGANPDRRTFGGDIPDQTCPECDSSNLDDFDIAEDEETGRVYGTFTCLDCGFPHADSEALS